MPKSFREHHLREVELLLLVPILYIRVLRTVRVAKIAPFPLHFLPVSCGHFYASHCAYTFADEYEEHPISYC